MYSLYNRYSILNMYIVTVDVNIVYVYSNCVCSTLNVNDNNVHLIWKRIKQPTTTNRNCRSINSNNSRPDLRFTKLQDGYKIA